MTLEEKAGQMTDVAISCLKRGSQDSLTGPLADMGFSADHQKLIGTVHGNFEIEEIIELQRQYVEQHPHHIPLLVLRDVIHGLRTVFPPPIAQGATFSPETARKCAEILAKESAVSGIHGTFAPMADLVRDPRWGRVVESTGEDPWLNGQFVKAMVEGLQGGDVGKPMHIAACVKHFAAYGAAVAGRDYNTAEISLHTLKSFYLPAYEEGIRAGAEMVMTSFNTVEGVPATVNRELMEDILRVQFAFQGVLITDYAAIKETIAHGVSLDEKDAAAKSLKAGVDMEMMGSCYFHSIRPLLEERRITEKQIDDCVLRILRLKNRLGLFENPIKDADPEAAKKLILCPEHRTAARETAEASFVLLKNEGLLPLAEGKRIAFIGPYVFEKHLQGSWAVSAEPSDTVSIAEAAERMFPAGKVSFHQGCSMFEVTDIWRGFSGDSSDKVLSETENRRLAEEALEAAARADIVVMAVGESYLQSGEATSRTRIEVPERQMELLRRVVEVQPETVVVLFNGRPLDLREISALAKSVLEVWLPGTEGGSAICNILTGRSVPQGKLPMSFPWSVGQIPVYYNEYPTGRPYRQQPGEDIRYLSKYLDAPNRPLYPFGYGLSYTTFQITDRKVTQSRMTADDRLEVSAMVANTGHRKGTETVQLYLQDVTASVARPVKELKAVKKVTLEAGERCKVVFSIEEPMLRYLDKKGKRISEKGIFRVYVGDSSQVKEYLEFELI